ncbi:hypothetical protein EIP91_002254 [Steccherinum ochraceum]|uniref:Uncharacterized protein n=1 Tax=Steccherinum ochraceum TaxID=92696 RepID=A0A4R0RIS0_9APHY|nr:hypothetical protein EIP91_002254 [Steccherinum ochraceum]
MPRTLKQKGAHYGAGVQTAREELHAFVRQKLADITEEDEVKMRWTPSSFLRFVSVPYHVILVAPTNVDALVNPSQLSSVPKLQDCLDRWRSGEIHFQKLSDADFVLYTASLPEPEEKKVRVDKGRRRPRRPVETRSKKRTRFKQDLTPEFVDEQQYNL